MVQVAELDTVPETIEATLNYFVDSGARPVTFVGAPGGTDTRSGGGPSDPRQVFSAMAGLMSTASRWNATAFGLCITTPRSRTFMTRTRSGGSITRRCRRW